MSDVRKVKIKVDGRELEVPADWTIIRACHQNGIDVPHYCYHQDLSIAGNCRICMVKVAKQPRPVVACATPVMEGMEVDTRSQEVTDARKSVMEFLLINHPLDCPECDQAGECRLQDYSYQYGRDHGRFTEEKVTRKKATFGPHVKYWGSRCILCTRCVRFTDEVSGTQELGIINRGDRSEIALFPGRELDNPLSLNTVDVCPVGALVSADFLYRSRVWYLHSSDSMCPDCSVGCNTRVDLDQQNQIKRIIPRRNNAVNKEWMCDYGRLSFPYVKENRIALPRHGGREISWNQALEEAQRALNGNLVIAVSLWTTNEALAVVKQLADEKGAEVVGFGKPAEPDRVFPGFRISGDKNPNRKGFEKIFPAAKTSATASGRTVLVIGAVPNYEITPEMKAMLDGAANVVVVDFSLGALASHSKASLVLPSLTHFEKSGSYTNDQGLVQKFAAAMEPVGYGRSEEEILKALLAVPAGAK